MADAARLAAISVHRQWFAGQGLRSGMSRLSNRLFAELQEQRLLPTGPLLGIIHSIPGSVPEEDLTWEIGVPVATGASVRLPLGKKEWPSVQVARALHTGPHEDTGRSVSGLLDWMRDRGYAAVGSIQERYLDPDPARVDPAALRTEIWIPCRQIVIPAGAPIEVAVDTAPVFEKPVKGSRILTVFTRGTIVASAKRTGDWHEFPLVLEDGRRTAGYLRAGDVRESKPSETIPKLKAAAPPSGGKIVQPAAGRRGPSFELGIHYSLMNSYARGGLDDWWAYMTDDPGRMVDAGSPAYFSGSLAIFFGAIGPFRFGVGGELNVPVAHSLWGSQIVYGGKREVVVSPWIAAANMPFRLDLGGGIPLSFTITPAVLFSAPRGHYQSTWSYYNLIAPGLGFGLSGSLETFLGGSFGLSLRAGMRAAAGDLASDDDESSTGYSAWEDESGRPYRIDLGGFYVTMGLLIRI